MYKKDKLYQIIYIVIFVIFYFITGCDNVKVTEGEIIKKWYELPRTWTTTYTTFTKVGSVSIPNVHIQTHYDDEDFCIMIEGKNLKTKQIERRILYLSKEEWNKTRKFQWYLTDEPIWTDTTKKRKASEKEKNNIVKNVPVDKKFDNQNVY